MHANKKRRISLGTVSRVFLIWSVVVGVWGSVILGGVVIYFAYDLPSIDSAFSTVRRPGVTLLAVDGTRLAQVGQVRSAVVHVRDLPTYLTQAVIATEDRRFYDHFGIDLIGIVRAIFVNLRAGRVVQGGSTITQQAAKNLFLSPDRTFKRKMQEVLLALWLERKFTKNQILSIYLNRVYLGAGNYGVEAAAQKYFGLSARLMSLNQAALIAGLLKAPSRLNPLRNSKGAIKRAHQVLLNMVSTGHLTLKRAHATQREPLRLVKTSVTKRFGLHFVDWIVEQLPDFIGPTEGDITVKTTLNPRIQVFAEAKLEYLLTRYGKVFQVSEGAFLALAPNGAIRALVGGRNYHRSQFNRATQAQRQPGSAFKPIVYLAGLENGLSPDARFPDRPLKIGKWQPRNYGNKYRGSLTLVEALAMSSNSIAIQVADKAGVKNTISVARRLGVSSPLRADLSIALGASEVSLLDLTTAYAHFANGGNGVWAHGIQEIRDANGIILYQRRGSGAGRVVSRQHIRIINHMLSNVLTQGTGKRAKFNHPAAGKTGTSQGFRDAWFVGYTRNLVAGVWLGNDNGSPMNQVSGGTLPAGLWKSIMAEAHKGITQRPLAGLAGTGGFTNTKVLEKKGSFWSRLLLTLKGG